jgi:hypothetical protein
MDTAPDPQPQLQTDGRLSDGEGGVLGCVPMPEVSAFFESHLTEPDRHLPHGEQLPGS